LPKSSRACLEIREAVLGVAKVLQSAWTGRNGFTIGVFYGVALMRDILQIEEKKVL